MTSAESKKGAACFAKCIDSTAPIAKFGAISTEVVLVGQPGFHLFETFGGEPGGANDGVNSVVDQELQIVHHDVWMGEVDDDIGAAVGQQTQRIPEVHLR